MTFTVVSLPKGYDDWNDYGTLMMTEIEFSPASDLLYVFSFAVQKATVDGKTSYAYFKIVSISDPVKAKIDAMTLDIVLPKALRDMGFSDSVNKVMQGDYKDTKGNTVHYSVDETATVYTNGYGGYSLYAYNTVNPDLRYCEQGTVISVDYAAGETSYDTKMSNWAKNDMVCCDHWVCASFPDMIGTVLTYGMTFNGRNITFDENSIRCGTNSKVTIDGNVLMVNDYRITASFDDQKYSFGGWSIDDGTIITQDVVIKATLNNATDTSSDNMPVIIAAVTIGILAVGIMFINMRRHD